MMPSFFLSKSRVIGFVIAGLVLVVGCFYFFVTYNPSRSSLVADEQVASPLSEGSNPADRELESLLEEDWKGCVDSDEYISDLGDGWFLYDNKDLAISFKYSSDWGSVHADFYDYKDNKSVDGVRCVIGFYPIRDVAVPLLYISSNDLDLHSSPSSWGLDANQVDLAKSDEGIVDDIISSWATSASLKRRMISDSNGVILEERGVDPASNQDYHRFFYLFPKYDTNQSKNLMIAVLYESDQQVTEAFLDTVKFY